MISTITIGARCTQEVVEAQPGPAGDDDVRRVADQRGRSADVGGEDLGEQERHRPRPRRRQTRMVTGATSSTVVTLSSSAEATAVMTISSTISGKGRPRARWAAQMARNSKIPVSPSTLTMIIMPSSRKMTFQSTPDSGEKKASSAPLMPRARTSSGAAESGGGAWHPPLGRDQQVGAQEDGAGGNGSPGGRHGHLVWSSATEHLDPVRIQRCRPDFPAHQYRTLPAYRAACVVTTPTSRMRPFVLIARFGSVSAGSREA